MNKNIIRLILLACIISLPVSCAAPRPLLKTPVLQTVYKENGGWIGINAKDTIPKGVEIINIYVDSPAEKTGLKIGDVIISVDSKEIRNTDNFISLLSQYKINDKVKISLIRTETRIECDSKKLSFEEMKTQYGNFIDKANPLDRMDLTVTKMADTKEVELVLCNKPKVLRLITPPKPEIKGEKQAGFMGIIMEPAKNLDKLGIEKGFGGLVMTSVTKNSPADKGGLKENDIIVAYDGIKLAGEEDKYREKFGEYIREKGSGAELKLDVIRLTDEIDLRINNKARPVQPDKLVETIDAIEPGQAAKATIVKNIKQLQIKMTLGTRMASSITAKVEPESNEKIHPEFISYTTSIEQLTKKILDETKIRDKYDDLLKRFADDQKWDDGFRLKDMRYLHRDPFKITRICDDLLADLRKSLASKDISFLDIVIAKLDEAITDSPVTLVTMKTGISPEEHCEQLINLMELAEKYRKEAFAGITQEDLDFLEENLIGFTERWVRDFHFSDPAEIQNRNETDKRVLQLFSFIDFQKLFASAKVMSSILAQDYLNGLKKDIENASAEKKDAFISKDTSFGKIIIGGNGDDEYESDAAIIIDINGNDFYANSLGGCIPSRQPYAIIIDFAGDDRYSSYYDSCQGTGILGTGILVDMDGNDKYIAQNWGQGTGLLGVGILIDESGHDTYKGQEFVQGAGLFGIGILIDRHYPEKEKFWYDVNASDSYQANKFSQGFAGPKALGLLFDAYGNDTYYATFKYPNGYPDNPGTFDGWSQGCGTGFRCYADWSMSRSGGLGILIDNDGADYYEAGTFSQGGGYFFGWGILSNAGSDNDRYLGTRYAQGFTAHSAIGYFIDEGGNDRYESLCDVVAGLSWDLTCTVFIDKSGNDIYEGGGFSLGASAHNGFCLFMDLDGKDTYKTNVAKTGGNSYHGGYSLSVFLDAGKEENSYIKRDNNTIEVEKEYSIFIDSKKNIRELLMNDTYKTMLKNNIKEEEPKKP